MENKPDEKELVRQVKAGGLPVKEALSRLYNLYNDYVAREAGKRLYSKQDVDDFCQEVWLRVIEKLPTWSGDTLKSLLGRAYPGVGKPEGIIGHYYLKFLQKRSEIHHEYSRALDHPPGKRGKPKLFSLDTPLGLDESGNTVFLKDVIPDESESPLEIAIRHETEEIIRQEIDKLPMRYRYVLLMRYFDGRATEDIAGMLNISKEDVWQRLSRGHKMLKDQLIKRLGENPLEEVRLYGNKKI